MFSFIFTLDPSAITLYHHISAQIFPFSGALSVSGSATASSDKQRRSTRPTTHMISCTYCPPSPRIRSPVHAKVRVNDRPSSKETTSPLPREGLTVNHWQNGGYVDMLESYRRHCVVSQDFSPRPMWTASCSPGSCIPIDRSILAYLGRVPMQILSFQSEFS